MSGRNLKQMAVYWQDLQKVCKEEGIKIVSPAETECMPLGFRTSDLVKVLERKARYKHGLQALQYLAEKIINHKGAGMLDYRGSLITNWIGSHKQYFTNLTEDDYERLCSDGYVYINNSVRSGEWSSDEVIDYLKQTYGEEEYEEASNRYKDGMAFFWLGEY